jgi:putative pyruvate formate lyase activating enzyme
MRFHESFQPSYLALAQTGELNRRAEALRALASPCRLCPRRCGVDRAAGELGFCRAGILASVSSCNAHHGEEPPISADRGSGTVFFAHCTMRCRFCQNFPISQLGHGVEITDATLAERFLMLQDMGCHNLNLVTASHYLHAVVSALAVAVEKGFRLPIVYNCSGFESLEALRLADGVIDIYMPDMKYADPKKATLYSDAPGYVAANLPALQEMQRQVGDLVCDDEGIARHGLLVRHLVLPGAEEDSLDVLHTLHDEVSPELHVSLMSQYFPAHKAHETPPLDRRIDPDAYQRVVARMEELGLNGWVQPM